MRGPQHLVLDAPALAQRLLGPASDRWRHVKGVAATAQGAANAVEAGDRGLLVEAAWLHDIGYASAVARSGFHALDGARYLRDVVGAPDRLCNLVAHHTGATTEASGRGLSRELLSEFPLEDTALLDALTFADLTTGPTGIPVSVRERLAEILVRYPDGHVVHESVRRSSPQLVAAVRRVQARLGDRYPR